MICILRGLVLNQIGNKLLDFWLWDNLNNMGIKKLYQSHTPKLLNNGRVGGKFSHQIVYQAFHRPVSTSKLLCTSG